MDKFIKDNCTFHPEISQLPEFVLEHREQKIRNMGDDFYLTSGTDQLRTPPKRGKQYLDEDDLWNNKSELLRTVDRLEKLAFKSGMENTVAYKDNSKNRDRDFSDNVFLHSLKDFAVDVA